MSHKLLQSAVATRSRVNREAGIIYGVSVITKGEAKGHNLGIDGKSLTTFRDEALTFPDGVRVKMDHGTGFGEIVGVLRSFYIDGGTHLRADLHLIPSHPRFKSILEIAETMPGSVGLSVAFSGTPEKINGKSFARCTELYSVDLVDSPAANPSGLFSTHTPPPTTDTDAHKLGIIFGAIAEKLSRESEVATPEKRTTTLEAKPETKEATFDLERAARHVFGHAYVDALGKQDFESKLKRSFYFSNLNAPGRIDFSDTARKFGPRSEPFGMVARVERTKLQTRLDEYLTTQTK